MPRLDSPANLGHGCAIEAPDLTALVRELEPLHARLCPRQVLGLRMGLHGMALLGIPIRHEPKRLLAFVETDGCFTSGVSVATGCWLGHRTMRLVDFGKVATTIVDTRTERAIRLWPRAEARQRALRYAPEVPDRWAAQLAGYQVMPSDELLCVAPVEVSVLIARLLGQAGMRVLCGSCGEEVLNGREVVDATVLCSPCANASLSYYRVRKAGPTTSETTSQRGLSTTPM